jgi:hypothetical protein
LGLTVGDTVGMMLNLLGGPLGDSLGLVTGLIIDTTGGKSNIGGDIGLSADTQLGGAVGLIVGLTVS